jgi:hypothetical protein
MPLVEIRAPRDEDGECLLRELAVYNPERRRRTVVIELDERSHADLLALLTAIETCVAENGIRSVGLELDGQSYTLAPH